MANVYNGLDVEEFIFGEGTTYEETVETVEESELVTDEEMNACGVIECVDDPEVACYRIALENEQNYNAIMNAMMVREFTVLESTGEEMVYEAGKVEGFFNRIKEMLDRFWAKVKGVFKKVMDIIASLVLSNKAFVKKYKNKGIKKPENVKEFKGFNIDLKQKALYHHVAAQVEKVVDPRTIGHVDEEKATQIVKEFNEKFETTKGHMRGALCGDPSEDVKADNFDGKLQFTFFGSKEKVALKLPETLDAVLGDLEEAKDCKNAAKEAYKEAEKAIKDHKAKVKTAEANLRKSDKKNAGMKVARCLTDAINASLGMMSKAMSVQTRAIVTKARQDRAIAAFYVSHQTAEVKEESAIVDDLGITLI